MSKHGQTSRKVSISTDRHVATVCLDGEDISRSLQGVDVRLRPGCLPEVHLDVLVHDLTSEGEARVVIPVDTHDLLVRLGWTPPAEEAQS